MSYGRTLDRLELSGQLCSGLCRDRFDPIWPVDREFYLDLPEIFQKGRNRVRLEEREPGKSSPAICETRIIRERSERLQMIPSEQENQRSDKEEANRENPPSGKIFLLRLSQGHEG